MSSTTDDHQAHTLAPGISGTTFKGNRPRFPRTSAPILRDMLVDEQFDCLEAALERARDEAAARGKWMYVFSLLLPRPGEEGKLVGRVLQRRYYIYPNGPAAHVDMWHEASLSPHTLANTCCEPHGTTKAPRRRSRSARTARHSVYG